VRLVHVRSGYFILGHVMSVYDRLVQVRGC